MCLSTSFAQDTLCHAFLYLLQIFHKITWYRLFDLRVNYKLVVLGLLTLCITQTVKHIECENLSSFCTAMRAFRAV